MSTFKYLLVVAAVLAAAFFLADPKTQLATNSYADVAPAVMSALPMLSPKSWSDDWYEAHKAAHADLASVVSSF
jgi:hypothetical protein